MTKKYAKLPSMQRVELASASFHLYFKVGNMNNSTHYTVFLFIFFLFFCYVFTHFHRGILKPFKRKKVFSVIPFVKTEMTAYFTLMNQCYVQGNMSDNIRKCTFGYMPREDSDQTAQMRSLIRIFTGHILVS